jgi:hypothetical protein
VQISGSRKTWSIQIYDSHNTTMCEEILITDSIIYKVSIWILRLKPSFYWTYVKLHNVACVNMVQVFEILKKWGISRLGVQKIKIQDWCFKRSYTGNMEKTALFAFKIISCDWNILLFHLFPSGKAAGAWH